MSAEKLLITKPGGWRRTLACVAVAATVVLSPGAADAQRTRMPVRGDVTTTTANGFVRLVFRLAEEVEASVKTANGIIIISFRSPVDVNIDGIAAASGGYVTLVREDPDQRGVRLALSRKVTVNSMAAGERLFVDLLPDTWTGLPPGLPQEVVDDLAKRAREAERRVRQQREIARQTQAAPIRVKVGTLPTFTRYVFEMPELIPITSDRTPQQLTLNFDTTLKFDLADARATPSRVVSAIESRRDNDVTVIRFALSDKADIRTFREDNNFIVDVTPLDGKAPNAESSIRSDELTTLGKEAAGKAGSSAPVTAAPPVTMAPATIPAQTNPSPAAAPSAPRAAVAPSPEPQAAASRAAPAAAALPVRRQASAGPEALRDGENLSLTFRFAEATPAAVFQRGDLLWLVFDTDQQLESSGLADDPRRVVREAAVTAGDGYRLLKLRLDRPRLVSVSQDGPNWRVMLASELVEPTRPLGISRNIISSTRATAAIPFEAPRKLHRIADPDAGDTLIVVTALAPARGFIRAQSLVDFRVLASAHGVVVQPLADDIAIDLSSDKVSISRPTGLNLSVAPVTRRNAGFKPSILDAQHWNEDRQADFAIRNIQLMTAAAEAPEGKRQDVRTNLARFYLARGMFAEAKGVLDVAIANPDAGADITGTVVMRGLSSLLLDRPHDALKDLSSATVGNQFDAPLWRAMAQASLGRWAEARQGFRFAGLSLESLPVDLQRIALKAMLRAAVEVGDYADAAAQSNEFDTIGIPHEFEPTMAVLWGRMSEGLGRQDDALNYYRLAADSRDRPMAAQGRLRELLLQLSSGQLSRADAISELETLTTIWRGDETENAAMQTLAHLYLEDGRYRDAYTIMRAALETHKDSELTRRIQDEAVASFEQLFLGGKGDDMPAIEALALFYDFRELAPIGRRGDEMIRRLADRLVSVDLLDQAAELLQHQVDNRLQGVARAQVATRLAVVYLMDRKPDKALAVLRATRIAALTTDLRNQRLLIEGRVLSDTGRPALALEVIENIDGVAATRLRSDILWSAQRWREAAEQIERLLDDRWQQPAALTRSESIDVLRAAMGYAMAEDSMGLARFRERYGAKIEEGPHKLAFQVVTDPMGATGADFKDVARMVASINTLDTFLRDLRTRFPNTGALPKLPPAAAPAKADPTPTGQIRRSTGALQTASR